MFWVVFEVTVGSSNFLRRFHPKVLKGLSGFNAESMHSPPNTGDCVQEVPEHTNVLLGPQSSRRTSTDSPGLKLDKNFAA